MKMKLTEQQIQNARLIADAVRGLGLHYENEAIIAAVCIAGKESGLDNTRREKSYRGTSVTRCRKKFGARLEKYSDAELRALKKNGEEFFNIVYNDRLGNRWPGDGYEYRGFGFNQTTGKYWAERLHAEPEQIEKSAEFAAEKYAEFIELCDRPSRRAPSKILKFKTKKAFWLAYFARMNAGLGASASLVRQAATNAEKYWEAVAEVLG